MNGIVKFFNTKKGFGFITNNETGEDIFVHVTNILGDQFLKEGNEVEYSEREGERGLIADKVKVIS